MARAIATDLAVKHSKAAGLIVQSSFTSWQDMTKRFGLFWLFPTNLILKQKLHSIQKVKSIKMPVLLIYGTDAPQISAVISQTFFAVTQPPKQLIPISKAGDDNNMLEQYYQAKRKFMKIENVRS